MGQVPVTHGQAEGITDNMGQDICDNKAINPEEHRDQLREEHGTCPLNNVT